MGEGGKASESTVAVSIVGGGDKNTVDNITVEIKERDTVATT